MDTTIQRELVLVVEDNAETRLLLRHLLSGYYEVALAATVDDALRRAVASRFDLLIIDINLGEARTGIDVLQFVRGQSKHAAVPALALTAYALPGDEERYLAAGFDRYLSKPFTNSQLLGLIRKLLPPATGRKPVQNHRSA